MLISRTGRRRRTLALAAALVTTALAVGACGGSDTDTEVRSVNGQSFDLSPQQTGRVRGQKVDAIADRLPKAVRDRGTLIVTGSATAGAPLRFYATDDHTIIGSEIDFAALVADTLGLKLEVRAADWAQNFVAIDSGAVDAFIGNVTVTEERKEKYDFATYRLDNLALEVPKGADWTYQDRKSLAGKRIGVGSGTNQEQLLVQWNDRNVAEGLPKIDIAYYQQSTDYYLALASHRLDGYLGPNPVAVYHSATSGQTELVATYSGAGDALQAEIAVLTRKDNGLIGPIHDALQYTIEHGTYQQVLDRWGLRSEAVTQSRVNPPGLPKKAA
ncbi:ABC transporter substrate-binding protein [Nocardia pseudobrasiliensis]|uniref:Amino acid ABC transporter substrate-binding protein (PAAT family) n=1 Tax=Nocardia pseudobrasiliensis TaxID=45979 RepID=A0A370IFG2_9NOCA|nr:ABC transporter substrate-binding protein [Nocardia pseudobrasiliensis]RDI68881.1 amino acid ABC transporter substrate-binding protein (PAAT family) [Nocardia pseudobrasiliensis]